MTTFSTPFMIKPDAGFRLGDIRTIFDAIASQNGTSCAYGIAAAGTNQATATQITSVCNQIDTATAGQGVGLPNSRGTRASPFNTSYIFNNTTVNVQVFAAVSTTDTINGTAGATGVTLPANTFATFLSAKPGVWFSDIGTGASFVNITAAGSLTFTTLGLGMIQKSGTNGKAGTFTLTGTTLVTVSNTSIATTDAIIISLNTVGGTVGGQPNLKTITAGTGFTVAGTALDTSVYNYSIISASI